MPSHLDMTFWGWYQASDNWSYRDKQTAKKGLKWCWCLDLWSCPAAPAHSSVQFGGLKWWDTLVTLHCDTAHALPLNSLQLILLFSSLCFVFCPSLECENTWNGQWFSTLLQTAILVTGCKWCPCICQDTTRMHKPKATKLLPAPEKSRDVSL